MTKAQLIADLKAIQSDIQAAIDDTLYNELCHTEDYTRGAREKLQRIEGYFKYDGIRG